MIGETVRSPQIENLEMIGERESKKLLRSMTIPSVEVHSLMGQTDDSKRFPVVIDASRWAPILTEAARTTADNQHILGRKLDYYPQGIVVDGTYVYTFEPEKTIQEARENGSKVIIDRGYKSRTLPGLVTIVPQLFPQSQNINSIMADMRTMATGPLKKEGVAENLAETMFKTLADTEPVSSITIESVFGLPVIIVSEPSDLHELQPYSDPELPSETKAFSYVVSRFSNRVVNKGIFAGFPLVVCLEGCPQEIKRGHMTTQLVFAAITKPEIVTPILVSKDPKIGITPQNELERFHQLIDAKLKDWWIIKDIIEQKQPAAWLAEATNAQTQRFINAHRRELFLRGELSLLDWLDIPLGARGEEKRDIKTGIIKIAEEKLEKATEIVGNMIAALPSVEYQLAIINYLSFFSLDHWGEAQSILADYEISTGGGFKRSFRIPPLSDSSRHITSIPQPDESSTDPNSLSIHQEKNEATF